MIETRIGLEEEKLLKKLPEKIEIERMNLIKAHHTANAWTWLLKEDLLPKFKNMEIVQSHLNDSASSMYVHILIDHREDMQPFLDLFENDENWEIYDEDKDLERRISTDWRKGPYIEYNYSPTQKYTDKLIEMFGGELAYSKKTIDFRQYQFDVYLYFFPSDEGECVITNLGTKKTVMETDVFEITCKKGVEEGLWSSGNGS